MKNKIYTYFLTEFLSLFIVILFTITFISWVIQAVNYLDFVTEDGHSFYVYFLFSMLSLPKIASKLVPLVFFISLFITIIQFEKNNELVIYWSNGIKKINFINQILKIAATITIIQIFISLFVVPYSQNMARSFLRSSNVDLFPSLIKEKKFNDTVGGLTIFVDEKKKNGELGKIFLRDSNNARTIFAKKGILKKINDNNFLVLIDGNIQNEGSNIKKKNSKERINIVFFDKTEINLSAFGTKSTVHPKLQEKSIFALLNCFKEFKITNFFNLTKDDQVENCVDGIDEVREEINKRIGMPLYIPILSLLICFLFNFSKDNRNYKLNIYTIFFSAFCVLIISQITIKYSGFSNLNSLYYYLLPLSALFFIYLFFLIQNKTKKLKD